MDQQQSIAFAKEFLENILTFFELNIEVDVSYEDGILDVVVPSTELNSLLIGRNAETLRSIQYLLSTTLRNKDAAISRVNLDIADYKKQRAEKIEAQTREWVEQVRATGDSKVLNLNAADRRVVHHVVSEYSDVSSHSEGEGRDRRIVISQASS